MKNGALWNTGYFLLSLDTELAWGYCDEDELHGRMFSPDGVRERDSIRRLLGMLKERRIAATWAVVGHLFHAECEDCNVCPVLEWQGRRAWQGQIFGGKGGLWYGADIVDLLRRAGPDQELAFHGYTHRIFNERTLSPEAADLEIRQWVRLAGRLGIEPHAVVFPYNRAGYLRELRQAGFVCYRGDELLPADYRIPILGKALNRLDQIFQFRTPQVYRPAVDSAGLVNLPASRWVYRPSRTTLSVLKALHLDEWQAGRIFRAIDQAAEERQVVHFFAHPRDLRTREDWDKLERILDHAARWMRAGRIRSLGMGAFTREFLAAREPKPSMWESSATAEFLNIAESWPAEAATEGAAG